MARIRYRERPGPALADGSQGKALRPQGTLLVSRPGRFRWEYTPVDAGAQLLVADGTNLWFYDRELQQATVKPAAAALTATPVMLLSGTAAQLRAAFTVVEVGEHDSLSWVQVTPRSAAAEFASAELGFRGTQLVRLVIHDRLNQTDTLNFTTSARGAEQGTYRGFAVDLSAARCRRPGGRHLGDRARHSRAEKGGTTVAGALLAAAADAG